MADKRDDRDAARAAIVETSTPLGADRDGRSGAEQFAGAQADAVVGDSACLW